MAQGEEMREEVRKVEAAHGVEGYTETQAGLEKVSAQKAAVDEGKGAMLDEISRTVAAITAQIKARESELVPRIQRRKDAKQRLVDLQAEMEKAHGALKKAMADASGGFAGLEQEVSAMLAEAARYEQEYHLAGAMEPGVDYMVRMVDSRMSTSSAELQVGTLSAAATSPLLAGEHRFGWPSHQLLLALGRSSELSRGAPGSTNHGGRFETVASR